MVTCGWYEPLLLAHDAAYQCSASVPGMVPVWVLVPPQAIEPSSACPPLQTPAWHEPLPQARATFCVEHWVPQAPQLSTSPPVLVSQPSPSLLPLQSVKPALHAPLQMPAPQVRVMLLAEHTVPQP